MMQKLLLIGFAGADRRLCCELDEMIGEGLVTIEKVEVIIYRHDRQSGS